MKKTTDVLTLLFAAAAALCDKKGADVAAYDLRDISSLTDYAVVATGMNGPHLKALANETRMAMKALNAPCVGRSGEPDSGWIVSDYIDLVVHVMLRETRAYYDLDALWAKAPRIQLPAC